MVQPGAARCCGVNSADYRPVDISLRGWRRLTVELKEITGSPHHKINAADGVSPSELAAEPLMKNTAVVLSESSRGRQLPSAAPPHSGSPSGADGAETQNEVIAAL